MKISLLVLLFLPTYALSNSSLSHEEPINISLTENTDDTLDEELLISSMLEHDKLKGVSLLHRACERGDLEVVTMILQNNLIDINSQTLEGLTPLHYAVAGNNEEIVYLLLDAGSNPDIQDVEGLTPLHFAAAMGNENILYELIAYGADVHIKDKNNRAAVDFAKEDVKYVFMEYYLLMLEDILYSLHSLR